jgi:phosphomethylpyrimidine synthase
MKISEDVRSYALAQGGSVEKVVVKGMQEKAREFVKNGGEVYSKI